MNMRDLIPWGRGNGNPAPAIYRRGDENPFLALHREVNRLFDDVFRDFDMPAFAGASAWSWPAVSVSENEKEVRVVAEVPGLEEKDVEVLLDAGVLTLRGEKKSEINDDRDDWQVNERFYGRFERSINIGAEIAEDKVAANFRNGVLTVTLPKTERAQSRARRIAINGKSN